MKHIIIFLIMLFLTNNVWSENDWIRVNGLDSGFTTCINTDYQGNLYTANDPIGFLKYDSETTSWTKLSNTVLHKFTFDAKGNIYGFEAIWENKFYMSPDGGISWNELDMGNINTQNLFAREMAVTPNGKIFLYLENRWDNYIYYSNSNNTGWIEETRLRRDDLECISIRQNGHIFFYYSLDPMPWGPKIHYSKDDGKTYSILTSGTLFFSSGNYKYAGFSLIDNDCKLVKIFPSFPYDTFLYPELPSPPYSRGYRQILHTDDKSVILSYWVNWDTKAYNYDVFISRDKGTTWNLFESGIPEGYGSWYGTNAAQYENSSFLIDKDGYLFFRTNKHGIYRTPGIFRPNKTKNWTMYN